MVTYCLNDVELTSRLFKLFEPYMDVYKRSMETELKSASLCRQIHENGFAFDAEYATNVLNEITLVLDGLKVEFDEHFPPTSNFIREINPRATKHGTLNRSDFRWASPDELLHYSIDAPFSLIEWVPFNPNSSKHIIENMWKWGWKPTDKTKGHIEATKKWAKGVTKEKLEHFKYYGWKTNETNLLTLPEDAPKAAMKLVRWIVLDDRRTTIKGWLNLVSEDGRIHPTINSLGAWTHRKTHVDPNVANVPTVKLAKDGSIIYGLDGLYSSEMRRVWIAPKGRRLVGVDAESIQLRIFTHLIQDQDLANAIVSGNKKNGTDPHTLNAKVLGSICQDREVAKTFIYAFLLGAAKVRISQIFGCSIPEAEDAKDRFIERYPGLKRLKESRIPDDAERGYFLGLDDRVVFCASEHKMLAGYLQNGESVIMKEAANLWTDHFDNIDFDYKFVDDVHDEWQVEVPDDDELSNYAGDIMCQALEQTGKNLGMFLPITGSKKNGYNWLETH